VKIAPPLTITEEALREGLAVLTEAIDEVTTNSTSKLPISKKSPKTKAQKTAAAR